MRFLKPLLMSLFLISLMLIGSPLSALTSQTVSASGYGIELEKSYPGTLVLELVTELENESAAVVSEAFNEGFKEGLKTASPEAAYWKAKSMEIEAHRWPWWVLPAACLVSGLAGVLGGLLVGGL